VSLPVPSHFNLVPVKGLTRPYKCLYKGGEGRPGLTYVRTGLYLIDVFVGRGTSYWWSVCHNTSGIICLQLVAQGCSALCWLVGCRWSAYWVSLL